MKRPLWKAALVGLVTLPWIVVGGILGFTIGLLARLGNWFLDSRKS